MKKLSLSIPLHLHSVFSFDILFQPELDLFDLLGMNGQVWNYLWLVAVDPELDIILLGNPLLAYPSILSSGTSAIKFFDRYF